MNDPEWLLATMAQSAAAIVAIVGGFLVSRVVSLASERQGLERRARELHERKREKAKRHLEAREDRRKTSWEQFVFAAADKSARRYEQEGTVSPDWLMNECWLHGADREEMSDLTGRLIETTQESFEHFEGGGDLPIPRRLMTYLPI